MWPEVPSSGRRSPHVRVMRLRACGMLDSENFQRRHSKGDRAPQSGFPETLPSTPTRRSCYGRENITASRPKTS